MILWLDESPLAGNSMRPSSHNVQNLSFFPRIQPDKHKCIEADTVQKIGFTLSTSPKEIIFLNKK